MLLEAQKGPESLQEALRVQAGNHRSQQDELRTLIDSLRVTLNNGFTRKGSILEDKGGPISASSAVPLSALKDLRVGGQKVESLLEALPPQLGQLEQGLGRVESSLLMVRKLLETRAEAKTQAAQVQIAGSPERGDGSAAVVRHLEDTQRTLGDRIRTNTLYSAAFTYTATAITISAVYLLLRGAS